MINNIKAVEEKKKHLHYSVRIHPIQALWDDPNMLFDYLLPHTSTVSFLKSKNIQNEEEKQEK